MIKKLNFLKRVLTNEIKVCEFALTNICTAKCSFCNIWKQEEKHVVDLSKALKTIDKLSDLGVGFITLTGGEPLLHPGFDKIIEKCTERNIVTAVLNADARLFNEERLNALRESGVDQVAISIDHFSNEVEYESRKIPNLIGHIEEAVKELKQRGINTFASILISDFNHDCLEELFKKCESIGFDAIAINYPEFSESEEYELGGDAISLSKEEIINALNSVIELKQDFNILNPVVSLKNIIKFLKDEEVDYLCLGGYRTLFVDWNFQTFPCMHLNKSMGDILELENDDFEKNYCNKCGMSWYRDFSIFLNGFKSIPPIMKEAPHFLKNL